MCIWNAKPDCYPLKFPRIGGGTFILELLYGLRVPTGTLQNYCCRNNNSLLLLRAYIVLQCFAGATLLSWKDCWQQSWTWYCKHLSQLMTRSIFLAQVLSAGLHLFFFKGVLRIGRHNPGDTECLIPQVLFWKSSLIKLNWNQLISSESCPNVYKWLGR